MNINTLTTLLIVLLAIGIFILVGFAAPLIASHIEDSNCICPDVDTCSWGAGCNQPICNHCCTVEWYTICVVK